MTPTPMQLGMVGLGRMGANMVERLRRGGHEVVGYDRDPAVSEVGSLEELVAKLAPPRVVWMMVPAGEPTEATVWFREAPAYLFEDVGLPPPVANHLTVRIQPDEGISFAFQAKQPGPGFTPQTVRMEFAYGQSFMTAPAEAYERLLHDAMADDHTLFVREDGVERAWEVVSPVLQRRAPLHPYPAGSWGPEAANDLIAPRRWHLR